jgi:hypothetical protein
VLVSLSLLYFNARRRAPVIHAAIPAAGD